MVLHFPWDSCVSLYNPFTLTAKMEVCDLEEEKSRETLCVCSNKAKDLLAVPFLIAVIHMFLAAGLGGCCFEDTLS